MIWHVIVSALCQCSCVENGAINSPATYSSSIHTRFHGLPWSPGALAKVPVLRLRGSGREHEEESGPCGENYKNWEESGPGEKEDESEIAIGPDGGAVVWTEGPQLLSEASSQGDWMRAAKFATMRAEKAERRVEDLKCRLEQLEEQFCEAEAELTKARVAIAEAASKAEKTVRAELEHRIAALNQRCNEAEAEVEWGKGERTRDLMVIAELTHKVEEHDRERGELEDKIRREKEADEGSGVTGPRISCGVTARRQESDRTPQIPVEWPGKPVDIWSGLKGMQGNFEQERCCGEKGEEAGSVEGLSGDGWMEGESDRDEEGPVMHSHQDQASKAAEYQEDDVEETPLELLERNLRKYRSNLRK